MIILQKYLVTEEGGDDDDDDDGVNDKKYFVAEEGDVREEVEEGVDSIVLGTRWRDVPVVFFVIIGGNDYLYEQWHDIMTMTMMTMTIITMTT